MAKFKREAYYKPIIRDMIYHENHLINHRLTWLCQIQGFLFTAFGAMWLIKGTVPQEYLILPFRYLICIIGLCVALSTLCALYGARKAVKKLIGIDEEKKEEENEEKRNGKPDFPYDSSLPVIGLEGLDDCWYGFMLPWFFLPIIFSIAWLSIIILLFLNSSSGTLGENVIEPAEILVENLSLNLSKVHITYVIP